MKANSLSWVPISIFYNTKSSPQLFQMSLVPFLSKKLESGAILSYEIQLNKECGDNVRFSMLCEKQRAPGIVQETLSHFDNYLKIHPSSRQNIETPSLFMDFPNNSIWFRMFKPENITRRAPFVGQRISDEMLVFFGGLGEISTDHMLNYIIYMHFSLIASFCPTYESARTFVEQLPKYYRWNAKQQESLYELTLGFFHANEQRLLEVLAATCKARVSFYEIRSSLLKKYSWASNQYRYFNTMSDLIIKQMGISLHKDHFQNQVVCLMLYMFTCNFVKNIGYLDLSVKGDNAR